MSNLTADLIKYLIKINKTRLPSMVHILKEAERFVCLNTDHLPELPKLTGKESSMSFTPLPLPFNNFTLELNGEENVRTLIHVKRDENYMGIFEISSIFPMIVNNECVGYYVQEIWIKGTENQKWKKILYVETPTVITSADIPKRQKNEVLRAYKTHSERFANQSVSYFLSFLKLLTASNTYIHTNEVSNLKKKFGKGLAKNYYTVRLNAPKKVSGNKCGGTHRTPIPHTRRSHIRRYSSGKTTVIPSSFINAHLGMSTNKHYEF